MNIFFICAFLLTFNCSQTKYEPILGFNKDKTKFFGATIDITSARLLKNAFGEKHADIIAAEKMLPAVFQGPNGGDDIPPKDGKPEFDEESGVGRRKKSVTNGQKPSRYDEESGETSGDEPSDEETQDKRLKLDSPDDGTELDAKPFLKQLKLFQVFFANHQKPLGENNNKTIHEAKRLLALSKPYDELQEIILGQELNKVNNPIKNVELMLSKDLLKVDPLKELTESVSVALDCMNNTQLEKYFSRCLNRLEGCKLYQGKIYYATFEGKKYYAYSNDSDIIIVINEGGNDFKYIDKATLTIA